MKRLHLYIVSVLILPSIFGFSQTAETSTYKFLDLPISARATALGGNLLSVRDNDLNIALCNPSLLSDSMNNNIALSFINYVAGIKYGYAALGKHFKKGGNFSAGIYYLDYGKMNRADDVGVIYGTFGANEMSFNLSYAHTVLDSNFSIGVDFKTIYSRMENYSSLGTALDFGATYYNPRTNFGVAGVVKNFGKQWITYKDGVKEKLPTEVQLGASYKPKHVPLRISLVYQNLEQWDLTYTDPTLPYERDPSTGEIIQKNKYKVFGDKLMRHLVIGGEFIITKNLFIRVGYNYKRREEFSTAVKQGQAGFSYGFGFRVYKFHFSYGRANYLMTGASNNFSISVDLNSFYSK